MSREGKLSPEEKEQVVQRCMTGELGASAAGRLAGVDKKTVHRWIARYEAEGVEGLYPLKRNRIYSPELKRRAVRDYLSGTGSLLDICKKYKIKEERQLRLWIKVYNAHGDFNSVKQSGGGTTIAEADIPSEIKVRPIYKLPETFAYCSTEKLREKLSQRM